MIRIYKRKLKLTKVQEQRLVGWIGVCRLVHNMCIEIRQTAYRGRGISVHKYELMKQLTDLRKGFDWVRDVPCDTLQAAVSRADAAYQNFFRGKGFPKFASKRTYKSFVFKKLKIAGNSVTLPKIGTVNMFTDSDIIGRIRTATLKIEPTGFFICIVCKDVPKKFNSENQTVGLDMGISKFCVTSSGDVVENPKHFERYERKLRIENRSLARKKKGSSRWVKQAKKLALLHHKIGNVRRDFLHKESTKIAKANSLVFVEDLKVSNMSQNRQLSKHILDCGWGIFREMLEYKTAVVKVDPKYTSQSCNKCEHTDKENRKTQAEFICLNCGHKENADINAAKNILSRGTAIVRQRESIGCALGEELHV